MGSQTRTTTNRAMSRMARAADLLHASRPDAPAMTLMSGLSCSLQAELDF